MINIEEKINEINNLNNKNINEKKNVFRKFVKKL